MLLICPKLFVGDYDTNWFLRCHFIKTTFQTELVWDNYEMDDQSSTQKWHVMFEKK